MVVCHFSDIFPQHLCLIGFYGTTTVYGQIIRYTSTGDFSELKEEIAYKLSNLCTYMATIA